jgi:hypothetical protein
MKYMLLIYFDESGAPDEAEREKCYADSAQFARELSAKGQFVSAAPLYPTATATSVRLSGGKRLVTDGPFAETREQLGGFFIVDVKDLDEAIDIASQIPAGRWGTVEIRPVIHIPNVPAENADVDFARGRSTN